MATSKWRPVAVPVMCRRCGCELSSRELTMADLISCDVGLIDTWNLCAVCRGDKLDRAGLRRGR